MTFRHGFKAEANRIALRIREKMGLTPICPIDPFAVCQEFDITLIPLSALGCGTHFLERGRSSFSAVTVPRGSRTAIVHNDSHHLHRQRSNICHELAHCFLGHKSTPPLAEDGGRSRNGGDEAEANYLAGTLLITNEAALYILRSGLLAQAQAHYGVSGAMLSFRLKVSGAHTILRRMNRY